MRKARLFAGLELPGEVRSSLAAWATSVAGREPAIRLVPPASLHVTLVFLGDQDPAQVAAIAQATISAARPLEPLAIGSAAWLPPRRPSVLVADLTAEGEALAALQAALVEALSPWHEPEARAFRPHVTVARVRRGQRIAARELAAPPAQTFRAAGLVLYRSRTGPGGSVYEAVARMGL